MKEIDALLRLPALLEGNLAIVWTFLLLTLRFAAMMTTIPGIGGGMSGLTVRGPAVLILAAVSTITSQLAVVPDVWPMMIVQAVSEILLGYLLGVIPMMIIAAVQTGAQLASTAMGLSAGNLIDPSLGHASSDLARILGDFTIFLFLVLGGHHAVIYAVSGLGSVIIPGTYLVGETSVNLFIDRTAAIFENATLVAAPVLVAMLLTNFVMGMISKAVPTVNIFIVSFPLTIGIGLILILVSMRDLGVFVERQLGTVETQILIAVQDTQEVTPSSEAGKVP